MPRPGIDIEYHAPFTTLLSEMKASDYSTLKHLPSEIRKAIQRGKNKMTFFMFCTCRYPNPNPNPNPKPNLTLTQN